VGAILGGLVVAGRGGTGIRALSLAALTFGTALGLAALAPRCRWPWSRSRWSAPPASPSWRPEHDPPADERAAFRGRVMALWAVAFLGSTPLGGPIVASWRTGSAPRGLALGAVACLIAARLGALALAAASGPTGPGGRELPMERRPAPQP